MARELLKLYPNDPTTEPPYYLNPDPKIFPERGLMWRRAAAISGDLVMVAGRRRVAEQFTTAGVPVYSYRFDTLGVSSFPPACSHHLLSLAGKLYNNTEYKKYTT